MFHEDSSRLNDEIWLLTDMLKSTAGLLLVGYRATEVTPQIALAGSRAQEARYSAAYQAPAVSVSETQPEYIVTVRLGSRLHRFLRLAPCYCLL
jgi:hypothetical protein